MHTTLKPGVATVAPRKWSVSFIQGESDAKENPVTTASAVRRVSSGSKLGGSGSFFTVSGSAIGSSVAGESRVLAEHMVRRGTKLQPSRGRNIWDFYTSLTHLHLQSQALTGCVEPIKICARLRVLYLYDNQLCSLSGIEQLRELTHLFAQDNQIADLSDFVAPSTLEQVCCIAPWFSPPWERWNEGGEGVIVRAVRGAITSDVQMKPECLCLAL